MLVVAVEILSIILAARDLRVEEMEPGVMMDKVVLVLLTMALAGVHLNELLLAAHLVEGLVVVVLLFLV